MKTPKPKFSATSIRRLTRLAELLERDANDPKGVQFDLTKWGDPTEGEAPVSCGTVCCAMGLAVASGIFKRAGLCGGDGIQSLMPSIVHKGRLRTGFDAAAVLFKISNLESEYLFCPDYYAGRLQGKTGEMKVARRIRAFIKDRRMEARAVTLGGGAHG